LVPKKPKQTILPVASISAEIKDREPRPLSEFNTHYIKRLVTKYGTDFQRMASDRKFNCDQLTAVKLQKMWINLKENDENI